MEYRFLLSGNDLIYPGAGRLQSGCFLLPKEYNVQEITKVSDRGGYMEPGFSLTGVKSIKQFFLISIVAAFF